MINEIKQGISKFFEFSKIKKTAQDMKEKFKKDIEILKMNQIEILGITISISQIKKKLEVSPIDWIKMKTEFRGLKTSRYIRKCS
jgi:hypothetical protein